MLKEEHWHDRRDLGLTDLRRKHEDNHNHNHKKAYVLSEDGCDKIISRLLMLIRMVMSMLNSLTCPVRTWLDRVGIA